LLHAESNVGPICLTDGELKSQLGKSADDIHAYLRELEHLAVVGVTRVKSDAAGTMILDLNPRLSSAPVVEELPSALSVIRS
jgi:hypothetical protein